MLLLCFKMNMKEMGLGHALTSMDYSCSLPEPIPDTAVKQEKFIFRFSYFPFWVTVFSSAQCLMQSRVAPNVGLPSLECGLFLKAVFFLSPLALLLFNFPIKLKLKFPSSQLISCKECNVVNEFTLACK